MFEKLEIFEMARAMMNHAGARQAVVSENIANANTPGYKRRDIASFAESYNSEIGDRSKLKATKPNHISESDPGNRFREFTPQATSSSPNGNSVSIETEIMNAAETRQQHDVALSVYKSSLNILRASIGR